MSVTETHDVSLMEPFVRLSRDMREASMGITRDEARYLADHYYTLQDARIRAAHQRRTSTEAAEPHRLIEWVEDAMHCFEGAVKGVLGVFASSYRVGNWLQAQYGIGPVLASVPLATFDIRKAPSVGHFWRFAGLDPTLKWPGRDEAEKKLKALGITKYLTPEQVSALSTWSGQHIARIWQVWGTGFAIKEETPTKGSKGLVKLFSIRPWNARLKCIMLGRLGESFVKFQNQEACYYGHLFAEKKAVLWEENLRGEFAAYAAGDLQRKKYDKKTEAYKWKSGQYDPEEVRARKLADKSLLGMTSVDGVRMLPPGQIHNRARRWIVKLFLSHFHHVSYVDYHETDPPAPYIFAHPQDGQEHVHLVKPPLWPGDYKGKGLKELLQ